MRKECGYFAGQFLTHESDKRKTQRLEKLQAERQKLEKKVSRSLCFIVFLVGYIFFMFYMLLLACMITIYGLGVERCKVIVVRFLFQSDGLH